jgi:7-cyano-7-deazaguanine synthase
MTNPKNAVCLVSGGMDSAVASAIAKENGHQIYAISFDYGQRNKVELESAKKVAAWLSVKEHKTIRVGLDQIGGSALTDDIDVPKQESEGVPVTYVPSRNIIFLSLALSWAEVTNAQKLVIGANAVDFSGYPDCRAQFIEAFQEVAKKGTQCGTEGNAPLIWAPLMKMTKSEIVKEGTRLGLDFSITSSCYDPSISGKPCGECDSCRLRKTGFSQAGMKDPLA